MKVSVVGRLPSIPEYYRDFIDPSVDLCSCPKQCCPFHSEDTPSFSYSAEKGVWRCFGGCHCGGDVIALHQKNYKFKTRKEAEDSIYDIYHVDKMAVLRNQDNYLDMINEKRIEYKTIYNLLIQKANTVEQWIELDYVMSKYPTDICDLQDLLRSWS